MKDKYGPEFPAADMELRDYFAAQALVSLASTEHFIPSRLVAKYCYELADAMLAERET